MMTARSATALTPYLDAFKNGRRPFLFFYELGSNGPLCRTYSRDELWDRSARAAGALRALGLKKGDTHLHCFSGNRPEDLALRLGAAMIGTVPVTVNWQADGPERIRYKQALTESRLIIAGPGFDVAGIGWSNEDLSILPSAKITGYEPLAPHRWESDLGGNDLKLIVFTSGTTGKPKGVCHGYRSFETNRKTFDSFLGIGSDQKFTAVVVNPLHHANATAITDWCLRHPGAELHLIERYSTSFWQILVDVASAASGQIIVPLTARHFDFLQNLVDRDLLPVPSGDLRDALKKTLFLLGSAPVGPGTVKRLIKFSGRCPVVRFGSTETCLQVMGIPPQMDERLKMDAFRRGWAFGNGKQPGYYIGRPHPPHTGVRIVASIRRGDPEFMKPRGEAEPGYLVTRGQNLMLGYYKDKRATDNVFADGWYTGLQDVGFFLTNPDDGYRDFYWVGRDSALLIRGGANYAYDQINNELSRVVAEACALSENDFELAVIGLRQDSEHEDSCCLTLSLLSERAKEKKDMILTALKNVPGKISRPDYIRFGAIPRNFKGAVLVPNLKKAFGEWFKAREQS